MPISAHTLTGSPSRTASDDAKPILWRGGASAGAAPLARRPIPLRLSERAYMKNARKVVAAQKVEEDVARMRQTVREALEEAGYPQQPTPAPDMYDEHGDVKGYPY